MVRKNTRPLLSALEGDEKKNADAVVALGGKFGMLLWIADHGSKEMTVAAGEDFFRDLIEYVLDKD